MWQYTKKEAHMAPKPMKRCLTTLTHIILKLSFPPNDYELKHQAISRIAKDIGQWVLSSHNGTSTTTLEISTIASVSNLEHFYTLSQAILLVGI